MLVVSEWKRWIRVARTVHCSFTDLAPIADDLGIPTQEMTGERALELTHGYVGELSASSYRIIEWQYKCVCGRHEVAEETSVSATVPPGDPRARCRNNPKADSGLSSGIWRSGEPGRQKVDNITGP